jgi:hypothetical protein
MDITWNLPNITWIKTSPVLLLTCMTRQRPRARKALGKAAQEIALCWGADGQTRHVRGGWARGKAGRAGSLAAAGAGEPLCLCGLAQGVG